MYFSAENLPEVNPVVMNYKIRHNKNLPARYSLAWSGCFFHYYYLWWQKNTAWTCEATCKGSMGIHGGILTHCVSQPEHSRSMNIAARTRSQILCSQLSGKQRIGDLMNVFLRTMSMEVIHRFLLWMILNIRQFSTF